MARREALSAASSNNNRRAAANICALAVAEPARRRRHCRASSISSSYEAHCALCVAWRRLLSSRRVRRDLTGIRARRLNERNWRAISYLPLAGARPCARHRPMLWRAFLIERALLRPLEHLALSDIVDAAKWYRLPCWRGVAEMAPGGSQCRRGEIVVSSSRKVRHRASCMPKPAGERTRAQTKPSPRLSSGNVCSAGMSA